MTTKTSIEFITPFRQWLSLLLAFLFMATTLSWLAWLYVKSREDVEGQVARKFEQAQALAQELVTLKKRELDALATGMATSPVLKSALSTNDKSTIMDVLKSYRAKHGLSFIAIMQEKTLLYADSDDQGQDDISLKAQVAARWVGKVALESAADQGKGLLIARDISPDDVVLWQRLLGAQVLFSRSNGRLLAASEGIAAQETTFDNIAGKSFSVTRDDRHYVACYALLGETLRVCPHVAKKEFWANFLRLKNKLLLVGAILGVVGLILGPLIGMIFARQLDVFLHSRAHDQGQFAQDVLQQIEDLKQKVTREKV